MSFLKYFLLVPFLTATLNAQIPYFGGYAATQSYYPGAVIPPYVPQPYYPQPYVPSWVYPPDQAAISNSETIDALTQQVQQLNEQIMQLQAELASSQAQAQQTQQNLERAVEPPPGPPGPPTIFVFKSGQQVTSNGYAMMGNVLWIFTPSGSQRVAVSSLDLPATQRENFKNGTEIPDLGR